MSHLEYHRDYTARCSVISACGSFIPVNTQFTFILSSTQGQGKIQLWFNCLVIYYKVKIIEDKRVLLLFDSISNLRLNPLGKRKRIFHREENYFL